MNMIKVDSSNIDSIGYDENRAILEIQFISGAAYEYFDVPSFVFEELMSAESKGSYANRNIYKIYSQQKIR